MRPEPGAMPQLTLLLQRQTDDWGNGKARPVEEYLSGAGTLGDEDMLVLIVGELMLRRVRGERPDLADYQHRFPHLAADLADQFALVAALDETQTGSLIPHPPTTALVPANLLDELGRLGLISPEQFQGLQRLVEQRPLEPNDLGRELIDRGWLTAHQVNRLLQGRGKSLVVGPYVILTHLGRGGMGEVFQARHRPTGQVVALKLLHSERLTDPTLIRRFQRESRAAVSIENVHVVKALEAGQDGPVDYLAMELIDGMDVGHYLAQCGKLPIPAACEVVRQAALGLQHIHEHGLVHRDIKPSNLMLARPAPGVAMPTVKLLDLGLARRQQATEEARSTLTESGTLLGTPDYMAPEQIRDPRHADIRADLYSLGCTFYHLLAGRPPFRGNTLGLKLVQHQMDEPERVETLRPETPGSVVRIVHRLLAKKPEDRFQTPAELAQALAEIIKGKRWRPAGLFGALEDEANPLARLPAGLTWNRRRLLVAAGTGLALVSGGLGSALWLTRRGPPAPPPAGPPLPPLEQLTGKQIPEAERFAWQPPGLVQVLGEHRGRHWGPIYSLTVSPDGKWIATAGSSERSVRIWEADTLRERLALPHESMPLGLLFLDGGRTLLSSHAGKGGELLRWEIPSGKVLSRSSGGYGHFYSPDGRLALFPAASSFALYDARTGTLLQGGGKVGIWSRAGAFTPDGQGFFRAEPGGEILLQDAGDGKVRQRFVGHKGIILSLACSSSGEYLLSGGSGDNCVRLWDVASGKELARFHTYQPVGITLAPAGDLALIVNALSWELLSMPRLQVRARSPHPGTGAHAQMFNCAGFIHSGERFFTGDWAGRLRVWQTKTGQEIPGATAAPLLVRFVAFSPSGDRIFTGGVYGPTGRLWDVVSGKPLADLPPITKSLLWDSAFSPDGKQLLVGKSQEVWLLDAQSLKVVRHWEGGRAENGPARRLVFLPDGKRAAWAWDGDPLLAKEALEAFSIRLWDLREGKQVRQFLGPTTRVMSLTVSSDGRLLLAAAGNTLYLWELESGRRLASPAGGAAIYAAALSPDGRLAVIGRASGYLVDLWDVRGGGKPTPVRTDHAGVINTVAFTPDGERFLSLCSSGRICVHWRDGTLFGQWRLPGQVNGFAIAPDGKHLATANSDGTVYILRFPAPPWKKS
jgi:serine/threonine-protein kinase